MNMYMWAFPGGTSGKESTCQHRRPKRCRFNPCVWKSPWWGYGNPLQYSCLENPMDRGVWQANVHRVPKIQTWLKQLSMCTCTCVCVCVSAHTLLKAAWSGGRNEQMCYCKSYHHLNYFLLIFFHLRTFYIMLDLEFCIEFWAKGMWIRICLPMKETCSTPGPGRLGSN